MLVGAVGPAGLGTILANRRIAKEVCQLLFLLGGALGRLLLLLDPPLLLSEVCSLPGGVFLLALALESLILQRYSFFLLLDSFFLLDGLALQSFLFTRLLARHLLLLFGLLAHPPLKLALPLLLLLLLSQCLLFGMLGLQSLSLPMSPLILAFLLLSVNLAFLFLFLLDSNLLLHDLGLEFCGGFFALLQELVVLGVGRAHRGQIGHLLSFTDLVEQFLERVDEIGQALHGVAVGEHFAQVGGRFEVEAGRGELPRPERTGRLVRVQVVRVPWHLPVGLALRALEQDLLKVNFLQESANFGTSATLSEILTTEQLLGQDFFQ